MADCSSKSSRSGSMPRSVSASYMARASEISSPGPCPPDSTAGMSGCALRYRSAASMRVCRATEGVVPLTPAPRTITASAGWADSSRCPARMTQISTADKPRTSAASPIWAIRSKIFQPRWRRLNRLRPSSTRQTSASPQLSFPEKPIPGRR